MRAIESEADFDRMERGARALAVIAAWQEGGLFAALEAGPRVLLDLPADKRALRATAAVLRHLGLLVGDEHTVALSPVARRLVKEGAFPRAATFGTLADLTKMSQVLASGDPVVRTDGGVTADEHATRQFLDRLHRRCGDSVADTLEWTLSLLPAGGRVLDLGGGHGRYAASYVDAGHHATLLDLPEVVRFVRERYGDKIDYIAGNFLRMESLGGPYDLVLASNIIHALSSDENRTLLRAVAQSLSPGGTVVLKDFFLDPTGRFDERAAFFEVTMLLYTDGGAVYTTREVTDWLLAAGFGEPQTVVHDSFELVMAQRS